MAVIGLVLLFGIIALVVVIAVQRLMKKGGESGGGADIVPYLVLALAMGVAGFALADLASAAFPDDTLVFDPAEELATSLSALAVSAPFLVYFWRRQAQRRALYPASAGWTLYLALMELVFMTAFVITAVMFLNGLLSDEPATAWTGAVVFGSILVFHEYAARVSPPLSDAGELRRVFGSVISLIATLVGLTGVLRGLFAAVYESAGDVLPTDPGFHPWLAMVIVGLPIWWYRWLRSWEAKPGAPRLTWTVIVAVTALATALGAATGIAVSLVEYVLTDTPPAGQHFDRIPINLPLVLVGIPTWFVHRRELGEESENALLFYRFAMAALGLAAAVSMAVALTIAAFDRSLIVGAEAVDIITLTVVLLVGLTVWLVFERSAGLDEPERTQWPRRLYTLGVGAIFGLVAAGALITTLFTLLSRILDNTGAGSLLEPVAVFVYSGLVAWHLLSAYARARGEDVTADVVPPFEVTIICSHPGMVATKFPEQAELRVIYRADDVGVIGDEMAEEIVAAVGNRPSFVWVDEDGFRVAPQRTST